MVSATNDITAETPPKDETLVRGLRDYFSQGHFYFGPADIFCFGRDTTAVVTELVFLLSMITENGSRAIREFVVVIPPSGGSNSAITEERIRTGFADTVARLRGRPLDDKERAIAANMLKVVQAPDLEIGSAVRTIEQAEMRTAVIYCQAARYRDQSIPPPPPADTARLDEDIWAHHLRNFAEAAVAAAKKGECYVGFDAGEPQPRRRENVDILGSVSDCGVLTAAIDADPGELIVQYGDEWMANAKAGRLGDVIASIDALPSSMDAHKGALKAQMFHKAGLPIQAVEIVRQEMTAHSDIEGELSVKFAIIAEQAGEFDLAMTLLERAIPKVGTQEWLEIALELGRKLEDTALQDACAKRLEALFPGSHELHRHKLRTLLAARDYAAMQSMLENPPSGIMSDATAFYRMLAMALAVAGKPDYAVFLADIAANHRDFLDRGRLSCIRDARARGLLKEALQLAMPVVKTGIAAKASAWALLRTVEQLLLSRGIKPAELHEPVLELIRYLAANPLDGETRLALVNLLSVQVTGTYGVPVTAVATIALAHEEVTLVDARELTGIVRPVPEFEDIKPFYKAATSWLSRQSPFVLGRTALPAELLTIPADDAISAIAKLIDHAGSKLADGTDVKFIEQLMAVAVATAPHSSNPDVDLVLIRHVAGAYALSGWVQRARDLAETLLLLSPAESLKRARMAWYGFADIYQRLHNVHEALVGLACALACGGEVSTEQAWYETYGLMRLLRDLNMTSEAASLLPQGRSLIRRLGLASEFAHRFDTIALGIEFKEMTMGLPAPENISSFTERAAKNCEAVMSRFDELSPVAVVLAQVIRFGEVHGVQPSQYAKRTLDDALARLGEPNGAMIRTISAAAPKAADVLALAGRLEGARNSEDAAYDVHPIAVAAGRLLDSAESQSDPHIASFAIELLADHGIAQQGPRPVADLPSSLPATIDGPGQIAADISRTGIDVHVTGLAESKALVRVVATNGALQDVVIEPPEIFSKDRLDEWSKTFPYDYGFAKSDSNIFHPSMRSLGLSGMNSKRAVFVMDTSLQQLPTNLLLASGDLIGRRTATAIAPSLSWLKHVQSRVPPLGGSAAWIPIAPENSDLTLAILKDRLDGTFAEHAIPVDTTTEMPVSLEGRELAIVAAHGGIVPEGRFFQVVADDADMKISTAALSRAVRNAGLVVLFVCSAGRFDKHPMANTTVGLAKQLLDEGCSTVIASPWPLDASVPAYWLPTFLKAWSSGVPVIDANFEANQAVVGPVGDFPANCLAMSVFGNPLLKCRALLYQSSH
jgi:hypothetical protein